MPKKLNEKEYGTDKGIQFLSNYENHFNHLVNEKINLLELGILKGDSLLMWRDYFDKGTIVGLDINPIELNDPINRIHVFQGFQEDKKTLDKIRKETANDGFDIIIDDASHIGELTKVSFWHLFDNHLKPGGVYVIEDWGTGYSGKFPDGEKYVISDYDDQMGLNGAESKYSKKWFSCKERWKLDYKHQFKSHNSGMVGFIKQLVDEQAMAIITRPDRGNKIPERKSKFLKMEIFLGQVFIFKNPKGSIKKV